MNHLFSNSNMFNQPKMQTINTGAHRAQENLRLLNIAMQRFAPLQLLEEMLNYLNIEQAQFSSSNIPNRGNIWTCYVRSLNLCCQYTNNNDGGEREIKKELAVKLLYEIVSLNVNQLDFMDLYPFLNSKVDPQPMASIFSNFSPKMGQEHIFTSIPTPPIQYPPPRQIAGQKRTFGAMIMMENGEDHPINDKDVDNMIHDISNELNSVAQKLNLQFHIKSNQINGKSNISIIFGDIVYGRAVNKNAKQAKVKALMNAKDYTINKHGMGYFDTKGQTKKKKKKCKNKNQTKRTNLIRESGIYEEDARYNTIVKREDAANYFPPSPINNVPESVRMEEYKERTPNIEDIEVSNSSRVRSKSPEYIYPEYTPLPEIKREGGESTRSKSSTTHKSESSSTKKLLTKIMVSLLDHTIDLQEFNAISYTIISKYQLTYPQIHQAYEIYSQINYLRSLFITQGFTQFAVVGSLLLNALSTNINTPPTIDILSIYPNNPNVTLDLAISWVNHVIHYEQKISFQKQISIAINNLFLQQLASLQPNPNTTEAANEFSNVLGELAVEKGCKIWIKVLSIDKMNDITAIVMLGVDNSVIGLPPSDAPHIQIRVFLVSDDNIYAKNSLLFWNLITANQNFLDPKFRHGQMLIRLWKKKYKIGIPVELLDSEFYRIYNEKEFSLGENMYNLFKSLKMDITYEDASDLIFNIDLKPIVLPIYQLMEEEQKSDLKIAASHSIELIEKNSYNEIFE